MDNSLIYIIFSLIISFIIIFLEIKFKELNEKKSDYIYFSIFVLFFIFMFISFIKFNPHNNYDYNKLSNSGGLLGFFVAYYTYKIFGIFAYFLPVLFIYSGMGFIVNKKNNYFPALFSLITLIIFPILISCFNKDISGIYGKFTFSFLSQYLGVIGLFIVLLFAFVLSFIIFTDVYSIIQNILLIIKNKKNQMEENGQEKKKEKKVKKKKKKEKKQEKEENKEKKKEKVKPVIITAFDKHIDYSEIINDEFKTEFLSLLEDPPQAKIEKNEEEIEENINILLEKLKSFNVEGTISNVHIGPVITTYEFEPSPGVKVNKITSLADDLALAMKAKSIRVIGHIPGKSAVGIEIPNKKRLFVYLKNLLTVKDFLEAKNPTSIIIGRDTENNPIFENISSMPHLLIAGTTGSGKSVCINSIITSILFKAQPEQVRFLMVDPKRIELSLYNGIPHLERPVITDPNEAISMLKELTEWMDIRYKEFVKLSVRNIEEYNKKSKKKKPYIIVIIDEMADLMMTGSKDIEHHITRLAQMSRAVGIHLILATQRPSVNIITGSIKANFPVRISFKVPSKADSKTIIDTVGAEKLLGKGDMLYIPPQKGISQRAHGAFIRTEEATNIVNLWAREYMEQLFDGMIKEPKKFAELIIENDLIQCIANPKNTPASDERIEMFANQYSEELELPPEEIIDLLSNITYHIPIEESAITQKFRRDDEMYITENKDLDPLFDAARDYVIMKNKASTSMLQRHFGIGYPRAARIIEQLEEAGIIGPQNGSKPREVYGNEED